MQSHFPRKDHKKAKFFTKQKLLSVQHQTKGLKRCFSLKEKKNQQQNPKWHPEDKWAEQTPDRVQFITKLQTHCLSKMVTAVIVLTHLNYHISHYCGDYSASINHKSFIFLAGLLAREPRQDIMPCTVIFHFSCCSVLMTLLGLLQHQQGTCRSSPANEDLVLAISTLWLSLETLGFLCCVLWYWPDAEPRHDCPIGTGKLLAALIRTPVLLLYEHWDGTGEPPSPGSHEGFSHHTDSSQLGEITAVSASPFLRYSVAASKPQNRILTAATYLNQRHHWVITGLTRLGLDTWWDSTLGQIKLWWMSILPKE